MKTTKTATLKQEGDFLLLETPYSATLVADLKDSIPWQERKWEKPAWKITAKHLETVRTLLATFAEQEGWELLDYTVQTPEEIEEQKQQTTQSDLDHHVTAVLAVLPELPARALRLVDWQEDFLTFELAVFLDDSVLFKRLVDASLESYRPTILYGGVHKREFKQTFIVAADERILHALVGVAGITLLSDTYSSRSNVEYFVVRDLSLQQTFADGIAHFTGEDGSFWIGVPYQQISVDFSQSREAWQVLLKDGVLYLLFERETAVRKLIAISESQYVNPGFGNVAVARSHPSQVARFVKMAHCEEWFAAWGNTQVQSGKLTASPFSKPAWYEHSWQHPADALLSHISWTRAGGPEMAALLGWSKEDIVAYRQRIKELKVQAAQDVITDMKAHAALLALPLLQAMTIANLLALGEKHSIEVKKSWGKERLVQVLDAQPPVCEDVIGLTKRLEGKA